MEVTKHDIECMFSAIRLLEEEFNDDSIDPKKRLCVRMSLEVKDLPYLTPKWFKKMRETGGHHEPK